MKRKTLVTYASRTGWTSSVAEAIGKVLSEKGIQTDILPMEAVASLEPYQAVIAGSAIHAGSWLPEAMQFLRTHQEQLSHMPFAVFLVCMTLSMRNGEQYQSHVATWLEPVRALVNPVSEGLFAGGLEIRKIPSAGDRFKFRMSVLAGVWKEGDHRNWEAIHRWSNQLIPRIEP